MRDSIPNESYPTHPLGARDSWPATGPIYGIPDMDIEPAPVRTLWNWLVPGEPELDRKTEEASPLSPIWY